MGVLNPMFVFALAGAGLPVLIHLLTRDRVQRVPFSTLRFFLRSSRTILRQRRVREMILLAMRMAACALLAIAFARPIFGKAPGEAGDGTLSANVARVIVLDRSGSMRRSVLMGRSGVWEAALEEARGALGDLSALTDAAGLVTFSDSARVEIPLTRKLGKVEVALGKLEPGHGGTNIVDGLRRANELLRSASAPRKEIVLVSDLQRTGWRHFRGEWRLAPGVRLLVEHVPGPEDAANVAVVDAEYPRSMVKDNSARTVAARVTNFSDEELRAVEVALTVRGEEVASQKVNLKPRGTAPVRFRHVFKRAGDNPGRITVRHDDACPEDNVFHFNARVIPQIKVLILNGTPSRRPLEDAAFFLKAALAPTEESPFTVSAVDAVRVTPADVADASVAVLANVRTVPGGVRKALGELLARGGGVLFLPGDNVDPEVFNRVFGECAPCKLRRVLTPKAYVSGGSVGSQAPAGRRGEDPAFKGAALTKIDFDHPVFRIFQLPHHGELGIARFFRYWEVTDSQLARVPARFDDGRPAILERDIGGGVSMMMVFPLSGALVPGGGLPWTDFPRRAVFVPLVHQAARYLAVRTEQRTGYRVGEALPVPEGGEIRNPRGEAVPVPEGASSVVVETPGVYTAMGSGGDPEFRFAVNRDFEEADPRAARADEIVAAVRSAEDEGQAGPVGAAEEASKPEADLFNIWWYVTLALALLIMGELFVANHTQRH